MTYHFDTGIIGIIACVICVYKKRKKLTWKRLNNPDHDQDTNNLYLAISNKISQEIEFAEFGK